MMSYQEVEKARLWAVIIGLALKALEAGRAALASVQHLPGQDVLPGALVNGVVYGYHLAHVLLLWIPAL